VAMLQCNACVVCFLAFNEKKPKEDDSCQESNDICRCGSARASFILGEKFSNFNEFNLVNEFTFCGQNCILRMRLAIRRIEFK